MRVTRRHFLSSVVLGSSYILLYTRQGLTAAEDAVANLEFHVFLLTNQQRSARNLAALVASEPLSEVARGHSREMLARNFFDHRTPEGVGPAQRLAQRGLRYDAWAENIFMSTGGSADPSQLASMIVGGWMSSESHRSNILQPDFRFLGVGAAVEGRHVTITELFAA
ncbi:MAG TPA: CAP domain-containing protein [Vicinamibacterales bacterium]|jgi:uncharacterized protein YkwD